jgi:thiol-disulfide isomerase/thioredoxin
MSFRNLKHQDFSVGQNKVRITNIPQKTPGMLLIWADWCPHCHSFLPIFEGLAKQLGTEFTCAAIENTQLQDNPSLSKALDFSGFPTLKFFDQTGTIVGTYEGQRKTGDILEYICKMYHHCIIYH